MVDRPPTHVWPLLIYRDAPGAIDFLERAFGFELVVAFADDDDPSILTHVQMNWPDGGGVMFGTAGRDDSVFATRAPGEAALYLVCTDPDAVHERAVAAGAEIVMPLTDVDYGSRDFCARDPEGNLWSFGTYPGS